MVDLMAQFLTLEGEIKEKLNEILRSTRFILGPNLNLLENEVASYHGVTHAIGLASGTDALHISLRAIGVGPGDEVITTPFTFIATAEAISYTGARPIFVDIDPKTFNIDPSKIEEKITERTRVILPVHLFGQPADMSSIISMAKRYNLKVIEDCAQAFGAEHRGKRVGTFGDTGCFSFYPSKNLGCYGDGGMLITSNKEIAERTKALRNHGSKETYYHSEIGFNSRLDEIQAGILRIKLKRIDEYNRMRRTKASLYKERLKGLPITLPEETPATYHVYNQFTIRSKKRDAIKKALEERSIASMIYYPLPLHLQEVYRHLGYKEGDLLESEEASREVLSLPVYPELKEEQIEEICDVIRCEASCRKVH
jgi:dTDP-4-amino-4,6-dideoxygalactose transaminase